MKFGFVGNIAGNVHALQDADRQFDELGIEVRVAVGNIVGMYPYIDECVDLLTRRHYWAIRVITDAEFCGPCKYEGWSKHALVSALQFTRANFCSEKSLSFLNSLPETLIFKNMRVTGEWWARSTLYEKTEIQKAFQTWREHLVFHAMGLDPRIIEETSEVRKIDDTCRNLGSPPRRLISVGGGGSIIQGSVNDGTPSALVFDDEKRSMTLLQPMCDLKLILNYLRTIRYPAYSLDVLTRREYRCWLS